MKQCVRCKKYKDLDKFLVGRVSRRNICIKCNYEKYRDYYIKYRKDNYKRRPPRFKWETATKEEKLERLKNLFEKRVIKQDGCWDWKNKIHHSGYATLNFNNKSMMAHRASWILNKGDIPENKIVLHKCDNRKCSNPDHLFLGSQKDNVFDMHKKGRGRNKLDFKDIKEIKKRLRIGVPITRIAKDFNINRSTIYVIKSGKTWKHVKI